MPGSPGRLGRLPMTTSPTRCCATGPFLSPAARRRGHLDRASARPGSDEAMSAASRAELGKAHAAIAPYDGTRD